MPVEKETGLICDQSVLLTGFYQAKDYPDKLRRVKYQDKETDKTLVFLTNNFALPAMTIASSFGNDPRLLLALRSDMFNDSIVLVVYQGQIVYFFYTVFFVVTPVSEVEQFY